MPDSSKLEKQMKAFGYARNDKGSEKLLKLREATLDLTVDEIETVIAFLQQAKKQMKAYPAGSGEFPHIHLRDCWKNWTPSSSDLIITWSKVRKAIRKKKS